MVENATESAIPNKRLNQNRLPLRKIWLDDILKSEASKLQIEQGITPIPTIRSQLIESYGVRLDNGNLNMTPAERAAELKDAETLVQGIIGTVVAGTLPKRVLEYKRVRHIISEDPDEVARLICEVDTAGNIIGGFVKDTQYSAKVRTAAIRDQDRHDHFFYLLGGIRLRDIDGRDLDAFRTFESSKHPALDEDHKLTAQFAAPLFRNLENCTYAAEDIWQLLVLTDARERGTYVDETGQSADFSDYHVPDFMYNRSGGGEAYATKARSTLLDLYQNMILRLTTRLDKTDLEDGTPAQNSARRVNIARATKLELDAVDYLRDAYQNRATDDPELEKDGNLISAGRILNHTGRADDFYSQFFKTSILNPAGLNPGDSGYDDTAEADLREKYNIVLQWTGCFEQLPYHMNANTLETLIGDTSQLDKFTAMHSNIPQVKPGINASGNMWAALLDFVRAYKQLEQGYNDLVAKL